MTLEERISRLEDIEEIKCLQARYQRCLDTRDFDGLAECFCDDATSSYGNDSMHYEGKDNIIKFLCKVMSIKMASTHLIHGAEVNWIDKDNATAKYYLEDHLVHGKYLVKLSGAAIYDVVYKKICNKWLIYSIGYKRCYEYVEARGPINLVTFKKKTFLDELKKCDPETKGRYGKYYQYEILKKKRK